MSIKKPTPENEPLRICCLPIAGRENPYQHLMMEGLRSSADLDVRHGASGKVFAALRTVFRYRPDVIHYDWIHRYFLRRHRVWTWMHAPIFILELIVVRRVFGCRIVWTMHNLVTHDAGADRIELWVRRRFARICEWIRVFDESTVERGSELLGVEKDLFCVLPEGSYVGYYPDEVGRVEARQRLDIGLDDLVLLYFGQIRPYKGIEDLLEAFENIRAPNWALVIAGRPLDERYSNEIVASAKAHARVRFFMEFVQDEEVQTFFNASDIVVLPFKKVENSGTAVLAMGFGKPVIAPRLGVLSRRLRQQDELLYDTDGLSEALASAVTLSKEQLARLGDNNRRAVLQYEWEDFARLFTPASNSHVVTRPLEQVA